MKRTFTFLILLIVFFCKPAFADYSAMYGNGGYSSSYSSSGYGTSGSYYGSASSASARYKSDHSYYNSYSGGRSATYSSNYNNNANSYASPSRNSSYGSSYSTNAVNYSKPVKSPYSQTASSFYGSSSSGEMKVVPFRYNTLNYTRVRKVDADPPKQYSAKCSDIGDASFCQ